MSPVSLSPQGLAVCIEEPCTFVPLQPGAGWWSLPGGRGVANSPQESPVTSFLFCCLLSQLRHDTDASKALFCTFPDCQYRTIDASNLKRHLRTHTPTVSEWIATISGVEVVVDEREAVRASAQPPRAAVRPTRSGDTTPSTAMGALSLQGTFAGSGGSSGGSSGSSGGGAGIRTRRTATSGRDLLASTVAAMPAGAALSGGLLDVDASAAAEVGGAAGATPAAGQPTPSLVPSSSAALLTITTAMEDGDIDAASLVAPVQSSSPKRQRSSMSSSPAHGPRASNDSDGDGERTAADDGGCASPSAGVTSSRKRAA